MKSLLKKVITTAAGVALISGFLLTHDKQPKVEAAKQINYLDRLGVSKVESGKIVWIDRDLNHFEIKESNGKKVWGNENYVDGFIFGKGQTLWVEYNKHGYIKKVDSYDPIAWAKKDSQKNVLEKFRVTSNKNGQIRGDITYSDSWDMGGEGIFLDKTYKNFQNVKDAKVGSILDIEWTKKDYENDIWDNIYSAWEE